VSDPDQGPAQIITVEYDLLVLHFEPLPGLSGPG
jgi:hypothetical protein